MVQQHAMRYTGLLVDMHTMGAGSLTLEQLIEQVNDQIRLIRLEAQ